MRFGFAATRSWFPDHTMLISHLFRLWITLLWVAQAQSLAFLLSQRCPLSIFEHDSQMTNVVTKVLLSPHWPSSFGKTSHFSAWHSISCRLLYCCTNTTFQHQKAGRFFKSRLCPCDLKHANMTFVCCFPSDTFFCQQLKNIKKEGKRTPRKKERGRSFQDGETKKGRHSL